MAGDGTWERYTDSYGTTHDVLIQAEEADCGMCCCAMIAKMMGTAGPGINSSHIQAQLPKGAYKKSTKDRAGLVPTAFTQVGVSTGEFHSQGTYIASLSTALTRWVANTAVSGGTVAAMKTALRSASTARPIIILVRWTVGGGHWIVVARAQTRLILSDKLVVLDPAYGGVLNYGTQNYASANRVEVGQGMGTFQPYWLQVN